MKHKVFYGILLIFAIVVGFDISSALPADKQLKAAPGFTLNTPDDQAVTLADYKGKIVLLDFWTSWCPSCKEELPNLQALQERYKDQLAVVGVNLTYQDSQKDVKQFLKEKKISFDIVLDKFGEVSDSYGVKVLPTSFLITPDGKIAKEINGELTGDALSSEIKSLIK